MQVTIPGVVVVIAMVGIVPRAHAQTSQGLNASEPASISQIVDGTKITIEYSRPRARGRTGLFGTEVKFGQTWTPGANQSTTLAVTKDVSIDGHPVAKGKYSVWMVVAPGDWELVLDHDTTLFHMAHPKSRPGQIRFVVPKEHHDFVEVLTWSFPKVTTTGMTLTMQWDTVSVPLDIRVMPTFTTAVPPDAAECVAGAYHWHWSPRMADPYVPKDTTLPRYPGMKSAEATFTVRYVGGELRATVDPPMFSDPALREFVLIQKKGDLYDFGRVDRGELVEVWDYVALQFAVANGHADSLEARGTDDELWATGKRKP